MKIHFIGIGGIGTSALAQYYVKKGNQVSGSDLMSSETSDILEKLGVTVMLGTHLASSVPEDVECVIYSPAVRSDNPEMEKAKQLGVKVQSYPEALGELTKQCYTVAVSGTHGKSTTTALIALILIKAGLDPTVIVGTTLKEFGDSNCRVGEGKYLVIEADEWNASFLKYWPSMIVLTNIEEEHLDYYKDLDHILKTYQEYVSHLAPEGTLVVNGDDINIAKLKLDDGSTEKTQRYSREQKEVKQLRKIIKVPGEHNIYNALAALGAARSLHIPDTISFEAIAEYRGAWRRFEIQESKIGTIVSDYAHHPTEIRATLEAAREKFPDREIWCVFQPHQYQRTLYLFDDFVRVLTSALGHTREHKPRLDTLIITDIYDVAGREKKNITQKVSAEKLVEAIRKREAYYVPQDKLKGYIQKNMQNGQVLIIMGAGDIYKLVYEFST